MTKESSRYAVIGAGLTGASIAWRLAQTGAEVTVLERDVPASEEGSSHGSARILRFAYPDRFHTRLVVEAMRGWRELEEASGRALTTPSGALDAGSVRGPRALAAVLEQEGVEHEILSAGAALERWPGLDFGSEVLWHPGASVLDAEGTVGAMLDLAERSGARVLTGWEVSSVRRAPGAGYLVTSDGGDVVHADEVVVAAGGWLPALLPDLDLPRDLAERMPQFEVRQENAFHFPYRDPSATGPTPPGGTTSFPTFIYKDEGFQAYGLPGGRDAGFRGHKVAEYNGGRVIRSAAERDGIVDRENRARVTGFVAAHAPGLVPEPYAETTCLFTNVPNEDMIVDRVDGVTIVSPCSGQGAKFAPLLGELVVDLIDGSLAAAERFRAAGQRFAGV